MSKFNVGDKVKIPKTKYGKPFIKEKSELKDYNKDYLIFRFGSFSKVYQKDNMGLYRDDNGVFNVNAFYESDLELYEERYKASELKNGRIVILCQNQDEFTKAQSICNRTGIFSSKFPVEFYPFNDRGECNPGDGTFYLKWNDTPRSYDIPTPTKCINFSQIDFEETNTKTENMKVKKFKLVKTKYKEALYNITGLAGKKEFDYGSIAYERLVEAGVLDLWCEEVPDTIKIHNYEVKKHNGGYKIGCKFITFQQLQNLKDFIEGNEFSDVSFGSYHITLEEIKQILAL